ncbi:MAG: hypothetical protein E6I06_13955 [Chloroflexi bacterium]|nr:MAG: hypothetical protein E6I06_13955 [Chloroflexota bacterium]
MEGQLPEPIQDQPAGSAPGSKARPIVRAGNVQFECLERRDLAGLPVFVQALDNQWLPRKLAVPAFKGGGIDGQIAKKLNRTVRSEYIRALVNSQQLVLNRAYLYNNPIVSQDYAGGNHEARDSFKALLEQKVLLPYLMNERTPIDVPGFGFQEEFKAWQGLCEEVQLGCIRLSWDDQENQSLIEGQLAQRFTKFVLGAVGGDIPTYLRDLGLDASGKDALRQQLASVSGWGDRAFAPELKQIFDLNYNCNLPDALGGYLFTPADSLPRTALQEWQQEVKRRSVSADEIVQMVRRMVFELVSGALNLNVMANLSLKDVREIRGTDEWRAYIQAVRDLVADPFSFADSGAARVYHAYLLVAKRITDLVQQRGPSNLLSAWTPVVEVAFSIAGAVLTFILTPAGVVVQLIGQVAASVGGGGAPIIGRLGIRGLTRKGAQQDLSTSIDFMNQNMAQAREQWREIVGQIRSLPEFNEVEIPREQRTIDPAVTYKEQPY